MRNLTRLSAILQSIATVYAHLGFYTLHGDVLSTDAAGQIISTMLQ